jgi:hypothetical protein
MGMADVSGDGENSGWVLTIAGSSWRLHCFADDAIGEFEFAGICLWWQFSAESVIAAAFGQLLEEAQMGPQNGATSNAKIVAIATQAF